MTKLGSSRAHIVTGVAKERGQPQTGAYKGVLRRTGANRGVQGRISANRANNAMLNEHIVNTVKPKNVFFAIC